MDGAEERALHDTAPNSDQEDGEELEMQPIMEPLNENMEVIAEPMEAIAELQNSPVTQHGLQDSQVVSLSEGASSNNILTAPTIAVSAGSASSERSTNPSTSLALNENMLCCANFKIQHPKISPNANNRRVGVRSPSPEYRISRAKSLSHSSSSCYDSSTQTVSLPKSCSSAVKMSPSASQPSCSTSGHGSVSSALSIDTTSGKSNSSPHLCSSDISKEVKPASSVPSVNHASRNEVTPGKDTISSPAASWHSRMSPARMLLLSDVDLNSDPLLAQKRKSEVERELASPGKRVRAMPESSNASMILNIQAYNSSPSSAFYGHFPVSPQTPTSKRRNSSKTKPPSQLDLWLQMFLSWDSADKTYALNELISTCDSAHVRHIMAVIEPQFQRDFISLLPKELALYVLSFLSPKDLLRAGQTCQYWRTLTEDNLLWRKKCKETRADLGLMYNSSPLDHHISLHPGSDQSEDLIDWKSIYLRTCMVEHHWRDGEAKPPKILRGHDDHVITCLEFSGNRIVSGSDDNTLKVWDVDTGECLRTLVGHTGGVWSSQMRDDIVISGSTDRTLRVWNTDTGECLHTLHGHTSTVRCLHLYDNVVVSGSRDATLRMWDIETGECLHVLMGHVAAVRCVQFDGKKVVSGAYDYTVRVWDPHTENCIHVLQGHTNRVYSLQFDGKHIVSGSLDTSIRVWDADSGTCLHTLIGHQSLTSGMEIQDGLLVSGNADSTVKVWDINTGACLQTLSGKDKHQGAVTCLQFTRKFVVTSSDDGTVKLWDLQTGAFIRNLVTLESGGSGGVVWRVKADNTLLVCASGSRNGTEDTKLIVLDFGLKDSQEQLLHEHQAKLFNDGDGMSTTSLVL